MTALLPLLVALLLPLLARLAPAEAFHPPAAAVAPRRARHQPLPSLSLPSSPPPPDASELHFYPPAGSSRLLPRDASRRPGARALLASSTTEPSSSWQPRAGRGLDDDDDVSDFLDQGNVALSDWLLGDEEEAEGSDGVEWSLQEAENDYETGAEEGEGGDDDDHDDAEEVVEDLSPWEVAALIQEQVPEGMLDGDQLELLRQALRSGAAASSSAGSAGEKNGCGLDDGEADDGRAADTENRAVDPEAVETILYRLVGEFKARHRKGLDDRAGDPDLPVLSSDDFLVAVRAWRDSLPPDGGRARGRPAVRDPRLGPSEAARRALRLYETQLDLFGSAGEPECLRPGPELAEAVLAAVAANARERGMDRAARDVVQRYREAAAAAGAPTPAMYRHLIEATARARGGGGSASAGRAEAILREAVEAHPPRRDDRGRAVGVTVDSFNVILTAWAKSGLDYGPERAEKLLVWMEELEARAGHPGILRPTVTSFTSLVDAYAQANDWDGASRAEQILNRMLELHLSQKGAGGDDGNDPPYDVEPNIATWTIVISAWTRLSRRHHKNAAARAHQLLRRMESLHGEGRISFPPDAIAYVTCMNALAFSESADGPHKAREILDEMNERYLDGDDSMKPSPKSVRILIGSFVDLNSIGGMKVAEQVLDQYESFLEDVEDPDEAMEHLRDAHRTMLFGHCKADDPEAARSYLVDMVDRGMKPDCLCWDRVIEAYGAQLSDEDRRPSILSRVAQVWGLMKREEARGNVKPNERLYTSYIRALAKGKVDNLAARSIRLLEEMRDGYRAGNRGLDPTVFTCNAVLLACSEDTGPPLDAFKVAVRVFNDVRATKDGPDQVTFGNMLRCARLLPDADRREALIRSTFQLCCRRGFVNAFVVRDLQAAAPEPLWRSLLQCPGGEVDLERVPAAWTSKFSNAKRRR